MRRRRHQPNFFSMDVKKYPNVVPIPGSKNQERIIENLSAWNVELTDEEFNELQRCTRSMRNSWT